MENEQFLLVFSLKENSFPNGSSGNEGVRGSDGEMINSYGKNGFSYQENFYLSYPDSNFSE